MGNESSKLRKQQQQLSTKMATLNQTVQNTIVTKSDVTANSSPTSAMAEVSVMPTPTQLPSTKQSIVDESPKLVGAELGRDVLSKLLIANKNYMSGDSLSQSELSSPAIREELSNGQSPDIAIITCADSRVSPEIVFGAGLGKVFVIRNAGNVAWGDSVLGSLEYAVSALKVPLVMVMGHSKCGAIGAAVGAVHTDQSATATSPLAKHVERIAEVIKPSCSGGDEDIRDAVLHNVKEGVKNLKNGDHGVASAFENGDVAVVGAVYDLFTGEVCVVDQ